MRWVGSLFARASTIRRQHLPEQLGRSIPQVPSRRHDTMKLKAQCRRMDSRGAMTLVEILVALVVISIFIVGLWELFISGSRGMAYGTWYSTTLAELRTGLRRVHDDLGHATSPSVILPTTVTVDDTTPGFFFGYHGSILPAVTRTNLVAG